MIYAFIYVMAGMGISVVGMIYEDVLKTMLGSEKSEKYERIKILVHVLLVVIGPVILLAMLANKYLGKK